MPDEALRARRPGGDRRGRDDNSTISSKGASPGRLIHAPCVTDLDAVPFPDYFILLKTRCDVANVMTTRGCPFRCSFCTTSRMFSPYRERSIDSVTQRAQILQKASASNT
jgi:radical SAM superfamily enzyme YgiQ (UPF0313 family)